MKPKTQSKALFNPQGQHVTLNQLTSKGKNYKNYDRWELNLISNACPKPVDSRKFPMLFNCQGGRVYTDDIPVQMLEFFRRQVSKRKAGSDAGFYDKTLFPTLEEFADRIGTRAETLNRWYHLALKKGVYPEYVEAYLRVKELQKANIIKGGMAGVYPPAFAVFVAKNLTDWTDRNEIKVNHTGNITHNKGLDLSLLTTDELQKYLVNPDSARELLNDMNDQEVKLSGSEQGLLDTPEGDHIVLWDSEEGDEVFDFGNDWEEELEKVGV